MAYDDTRQVVVMFGGADARSVRADTWIWNGSRWREVSVTGPAARAEAAVAYDSKRGRVVLFGGYNDAGGQRQRLGDLGMGRQRVAPGRFHRAIAP